MDRGKPVMRKWQRLKEARWRVLSDLALGTHWTRSNELPDVRLHGGPPEPLFQKPYRMTEDTGRLTLLEDLGMEGDWSKKAVRWVTCRGRGTI